MKIYNYISMLFLAGTAMLASCTQGEEPGGEMDAIDAFGISVSDNGFQNVDGATRAIENGYTTKFGNGDAIGVFGVKGTSVVSDINNRKFTMKDGLWELEGNAIEYKSSEFKGMKFFAYYPYNENVMFNPESEEDPFVDYVSQWEVGEDQSAENYTKYDLMTSLGEAQGERLKGKVSFVMEHRMALVVLDKPTVTYDFNNEGVADYVLKTDFDSFSLNGKSATPYYQASTDTYRFLLKPGVDNTIKNSYTGVKPMESEIKANLGKGASKLYKIQDPNKFQQTLAVGDYFCADGSIVSKNAASAPENAVGVVFYVGNPQPSVTHPEKVTVGKDALLRDYPDAVHGLVMALNNTQTDATMMGTPNASYSDHVKGDEKLNAMYTLCNTKVFADFPGYMGYNNTAILLLTHEAYTDRYLTTVEQINGYRASVVLPENVTPWYIPGYSELQLMSANREALNSTVTKAGGTELVQSEGSVGFYWSSTERNGNTQWVHGLQDTEERVERRDLGSRSGYFRMAFAF